MLILRIHVAHSSMSHRMLNSNCLSQQIVRYHMDHSEYDNIIETCKRFRNEPYLWVQALTYFAQREEDCKDHLVQVLDQIDEKNLIPPLLVGFSNFDRIPLMTIPWFNQTATFCPGDPNPGAQFHSDAGCGERLHHPAIGARG